jgi:protein required for attachment to host cells
MVVDGARMAMMRNAGNMAEPRLEIVEQAHRQAPRTSALGTDRPGRTAQSGQAARSAVDGPDFHAQAEVEFTAAAAARLADLLKRDDAPAILVAEPRVLGIMRDHLDPHIRKRLIAEIDKDFAGRSAADLAEMLTEYDD